ncbi:MAG: HAMP domain-containing histidine kinase [Thiomargarita sp.]|nr:HAMP domain-containing histidine kinase [Bacteroidales bacterium]MCK5716550.1 HAMP domain-containing histidine kinase [Thiomargarita sp.]
MNTHKPIMLAIDDSPTKLVLIKQLLKENGFHVLAEPNAKQNFLKFEHEVEKKVEERTAVLKKEKEKAEKENITKSQFIAKISHELRIPMTAIKGFSEILLEDAEDLGLDDFKIDLKNIHTAGEYLLELINGVLDMAKIESGKMDIFLEKFSVNMLINEVLPLIQPFIDKNNNKLELRISDELGEIHADMLKTRQIIFNLLSNAAKFTREGIICLEIQRQHIKEQEMIYICVSDNGIGMTSEQQNKLFQPFSQVDNSIARNFGGAGLGLSIIKHFTEMMGGVITVNSIFTKGSTFTILLPVTQTQH